MIDGEVTEVNGTKTNLLHKAIVINRPLYDHKRGTVQETSIESHRSNMKATMIKISQSNLIGIGLGVLLFALTLIVLLGLVFQKTDYTKKADNMEDNFVSFDSKVDSSARNDQVPSLCSWPEVHNSKSDSHEDLHSLDNDSFLNSLEAITTTEYWSETSWNSP